MNYGTGLRRVASVIRWLGCGSGALAAGIGVIAAFSHKARDAADAALLLGSFALIGALIAGAAWALAWVIEGFAKES